MQIRIESMACDGKGQVTSNMFKMTLCAKDCLSSTTLGVTSSKSKLHREPSNYCTCVARCCVQWQAKIQIKNKPWSSTTVLFWDAALIQFWDMLGFDFCETFLTLRPWINLVDTAEKVASIYS